MNFGSNVIKVYPVSHRVKKGTSIISPYGLLEKFPIEQNITRNLNALVDYKTFSYTNNIGQETLDNNTYLRISGKYFIAGYVMEIGSNTLLKLNNYIDKSKTYYIYLTLETNQDKLKYQDTDLPITQISYKEEGTVDYSLDKQVEDVYCFMPLSLKVSETKLQEVLIEGNTTLYNYLIGSFKYTPKNDIANWAVSKAESFKLDFNSFGLELNKSSGLVKRDTLVANDWLNNLVIDDGEVINSKVEE